MKLNPEERRIKEERKDQKEAMGRLAVDFLELTGRERKAEKKVH